MPKVVRPRPLPRGVLVGTGAVRVKIHRRDDMIFALPPFSRRLNLRRQQGCGVQGLVSRPRDDALSHADVRWKEGLAGSLGVCSRKSRRTVLLQGLQSCLTYFESCPRAFWHDGSSRCPNDGPRTIECMRSRCGGSSGSHLLCHRYKCCGNTRDVTQAQSVFPRRVISVPTALYKVKRRRLDEQRTPIQTSASKYCTGLRAATGVHGSHPTRTASPP